MIPSTIKRKAPGGNPMATPQADPLAQAKRLLAELHAETQHEEKRLHQMHTVGHDHFHQRLNKAVPTLTDGNTSTMGSRPILAPMGSSFRHDLIIGLLCPDLGGAGNEPLKEGGQNPSKLSMDFPRMHIFMLADQAGARDWSGRKCALGVPKADFEYPIWRF